MAQSWSFSGDRKGWGCLWVRVLPCPGKPGSQLSWHCQQQCGVVRSFRYLEVRRSQVQILTLPCTSCVTLGQVPGLSDLVEMTVTPQLVGVGGFTSSISDCFLLTEPRVDNCIQGDRHSEKSEMTIACVFLRAILPYFEAHLPALFQERGLVSSHSSMSPA